MPLQPGNAPQLDQYYIVRQIGRGVLDSSTWRIQRSYTKRQLSRS